MNKPLTLWMIAGIFDTFGAAQGDTAWSTQDYDLHAGDFNGDALSDVLYIAHDASHLSGITLSDGTGFNIPLQAWNNAYLGIPWTSGEYTIVVADFNGDGRDDLFLQRRTPGDHYLLLTEDGGIGAISQTIPDYAMGLNWSAEAHRIVAGDFNGDKSADLFLQPTEASGLSAVVLADDNGQFTATAPHQSWSDGYAGFSWSAADAIAFAGDFNGDGRSDLLLQAQPLAGTGPGTDTAAVFSPNSNGVVLARDGRKIFVTEGVQAWSEDGFGAQWSPLRSVLLVGDFNGDQRRDVLLQGLTATDSSYLLYGRAAGAVFELAATFDEKTMPTADQNHVFVGRFSSTEFDALYFQALDPAKSNFVGTLSGSGVAVSMPDASLATAVGAASQAPVGGGAVAAALLAVTSAGRTPGQFAVSALGGATYQIPIWTPPGARGIEPKLALVYMSGGADGPLGPGWSLAGLSVLARCGKTYASSNGAPAAVALTTSDDICLDGNRLRRTSGSLLVAGSVFQTEIANFSRVTAYGTAGNGPSYFIAEGKDGLKYEYGNTADSKAYTNGGSTPYAWMLNKVRDRQGNNLVVTYSTTSGDIQPNTIYYTQTPATGTTYWYTVSFTYQNRVTNLSKYVAGGNILQTKVLGNINVRHFGTSIRQYNLTYQTAPTTQRDRLASVQECGGAGGTDCLRPTTITYQNGALGAVAPTTSTGSGPTNGALKMADIDGDGREDLLFATTSGSNYVWWVQLATASGYTAPVSTGATSPSTAPVLLDDFDGNGKADILARNGTLWYVYRWNGSSFGATSTGLAVDATLPTSAPADVDGDGLPDLVSAKTVQFGTVTVFLQRNLTASGGPVTFASTASVAYTTPYGPYGSPTLFGNNDFINSSIRHMDFDGDGRDDLVLKMLAQFSIVHVRQLMSRGSTFVSGVSGVAPTFVPTRWNDDACSDMIRAGLIHISACNGTDAVTISTGAAPTLTLDWDGDGRLDALANQTSGWTFYRSLGTAAAAGVSTGITVGPGKWFVTDQNGDGLTDLGYANSSAGNAISYGNHNGSATPADLATIIKDGWEVSASSTYVPITQNNYTKYADATFPDMDFQGPLYVVSQASQSNGVGGTFTNSFWYYGARINRQGRGFEGFEKTRSQDNRNNLYRYVNYRRDYPYIGRVAQDDIYKPDGTSLITRTVNTYSVIDLAGAGCTSAISATNRCFPYVSRETVTTREITAGAPLIQTAVTDFVYDNYGSPTSITTTTTDNDSTSPFYNSVWQSVVSNTYLNDVTNWCLGRPTTTTTQNTAPGQPSATRRVDHTVDVVACRFNTETVEPLSTTLKVVTTFTYNAVACGNVSSLSVVGLDKNGVAMPARVTSSTYGTRCTFAESVTNPLNEVTNIGYNYNYGQRSSTTDPNGAAVSWLYDNFARRTSETRPDSTSSTWTYADCVSEPCWGTTNLRLQVIETQKDSGAVVIRTLHQYFDGFERLRYDEGHRVLGVWTNMRIDYNALGLKQYVYQPYSSASNGRHYFVYDVLNRPTSDTLYNSSGAVDRVTSLAYAGLKTTLTDAKGNVTQKWSDVTGKLRRIIDPSPGGTTNYVLDPFGNLVQMTDAAGAITTYTYNIRGFKTASSDPDIGSWTYTPNSLNELVSQTDNKNQTITFDYDKLGRLISRLEPESATPTTWVYGSSAALHEIGRLKSVSKPDGYAEAYTFDSIGRPASATYTEDTTYQVNYTYNSIGTLDTLTYPTSTSGYRFALKYLYSYGFLQQVKDNAAGTVFWSLSAANDYSAPTTELLGNGVKITSGYTPWTNDLTIRQEGTGGSTTNLQNLAYQWDLNGNLQQRQDLAQNLTEVFVHDALNRLDTSTLNGEQNLNVDYNAAGNITTKSDVGGYNYTTNQAGCSYTGLPAQPHAVRNAGGVVFCYDKNGNMTSRGGSAISWYSYNQPNLIASGSNSTQFNYNANHQRWKQVAVDAGSTTTTYYVGGILEKVIRPTGVTEYRHLIPAGSGMAIYPRRSDATNSTYYVTTDHLGSGDLILDSAGAVLARESFTPFGERRGSNWQGLPSAGDKTVFGNVTRRGFTGHEMLDAVSLIHMNGRVYDPRLGRFLSVDPIIQTISLSQALNPFSYVMNNPLTLIDPSGYSWLSKAFKKAFKWLANTFKQIITQVAIGIVASLCGPAAAVCAVGINIAFRSGYSDVYGGGSSGGVGSGATGPLPTFGGTPGINPTPNIPGLLSMQGPSATRKNTAASSASTFAGIGGVLIPTETVNFLYRIWEGKALGDAAYRQMGAVFDAGIRDIESYLATGVHVPNPYTDKIVNWYELNIDWENYRRSPSDTPHDIMGNFLREQLRSKSKEGM